MVGHTPVRNIEREGNVISCDVFSTNPNGVEADELHNRPDNLDLIKNEIDQWVNSLR